MAKRQKTIYAGRIVHRVVYSAPYPRDPQHVRAAKTKCSTEARKCINMKKAWQKLEMLLSTNFDLRDLHLVLTYRNDCLPNKKEDAIKLLKKFLAALRAYRRARGQELKYIYVTESKHDEGRLHHHLIINGTGADIEIIRSLWEHGDNVNIEYLDMYGYEELAKYLTKEPREHGKEEFARMWVPSLNLKKPEIECGWVSDSTTLSPPAGCIVLASRSERNEFGEYAYIKYMIPDYKPRKSRPPRKRKNEN